MRKVQGGKFAHLTFAGVTLHFAHDSGEVPGYTLSSKTL